MIDPTAPVAVLANPRAGRGRYHGLLPRLHERLAAAGRPLRPLWAGTPAEAELACRAAVAEGVAALVAVGGDGTAHVALQAVAGTPVPFGVVPTGTGNDIARELGVPPHPVAAAAELAAGIGAGATRAFDLARVAGPAGYTRWYAGVLAAGFDAVVNERANRMRFPRGRLRYHRAIVAELATLRSRPYTLRLDGVDHRVDAVLVAVGNAPSYGGGMRICPAADPTDGVLDVLVADVDRVALVGLLPSVYRGTHTGHSGVRTYRARTVELACDGIVAYADGERACPLPVAVTVVPAALRALARPGRA